MLATVHRSYYKRCPSGAGIIPDFLMNVPLTVLSEDEQLFRDSCRCFAQERIRPLVRKMDEEAKLEDSVIPDLFQLGLMGIHIPEEFGGSSGSFFMSVLAVEEISRVDASFGVFIDVQNTLVNNAIMRWATDDQKSKYLPRLARDMVGAYALSEAGSGSDAFALASRASDKGDHFILNGRKLWITNAVEANLFIVFANVSPEQGYKGITAFLVERDFPGFAVGKKDDKLGIRASSTCELILEDCRVPRANMLGAWKRLQDCDRDAQRGTHRHRSSNGRRCSEKLGTWGRIFKGKERV